MKSSIWVNLLLGEHPLRRGMVRDLLLSLPIYISTLSLLGVSVFWNLTNPFFAQIQALYLLLGFAFFYGLMRHGTMAEAYRQHYAYAHLLYGITNIGLAYLFFEPFRMWAVPLLCVLLVFDMLKFSARQIRRAAMLALVLIVLAVLFRDQWGQPAPFAEAELFSLAGALLFLPIVVLIVRRVQSLQTQLNTQQIELTKKLDRLQELATIDALTGIMGRRQMAQLIEDELLRQKRHPRALCLAMLDIDHFKRINDGYGHATGDAVLREFSRLADAARQANETLARWGGEEFVLLLPGFEMDEAYRTLSHIHEIMARHDWSEHAPGLAVTFSAGLACRQPDETLDAWLERADAALYVAKSHGRARTERA